MIIAEKEVWTQLEFDRTPHGQFKVFVAISNDKNFSNVVRFPLNLSEKEIELLRKAVLEEIEEIEAIETTPPGAKWRTFKPGERK